MEPGPVYRCARGANHQGARGDGRRSAAAECWALRRATRLWDAGLVTPLACSGEPVRLARNGSFGGPRCLGSRRPTRGRCHGGYPLPRAASAAGGACRAGWWSGATRARVVCVRVSGTRDAREGPVLGWGQCRGPALMVAERIPRWSLPDVWTWCPLMRSWSAAPGEVSGHDWGVGCFPGGDGAGAWGC